MSEDPTRAGEGGPADEDAMVHDPGVDAHIFETEWAAAWEEVPDEPAESLPVLDDIIGRMLITAGYHLDDPVAARVTSASCSIATGRCTRPSRTTSSTTRRAMSQTRSTR